MNAIVVVDRNWCIGRDGKLLVHLPGDLKYFKEKTLGKTIVIGRKTLESFPGGNPLPQRENVVVTGNGSYCNDNCTICYSFEGLLDVLGRIPKDQVFIAGGQSVYEQFMPYVSTIYVTKVDNTYEGDRYFPNLDEDEDFQLTWTSPDQFENGVKYNFAKYQRKQP